mmetsp:Transcript_43908/g.130032  ORF Transcript_43908/g.130032 Transcript_43908/m.130032 type:complete len:207 (+) Transcript_43908:92-712(+)
MGLPRTSKSYRLEGVGRVAVVVQQLRDAVAHGHGARIAFARMTIAAVLAVDLGAAPDRGRAGLELFVAEVPEVLPRIPLVEVRGAAAAVVGHLPGPHAVLRSPRPVGAVPPDSSAVAVEGLVPSARPARGEPPCEMQPVRHGSGGGDQDQLRGVHGLEADADVLKDLHDLGLELRGIALAHGHAQHGVVVLVQEAAGHGEYEALVG